jgi:hypothetical protein
MSFPIKGAEGGVHGSSPIPFAEQELKIDNPHWELIEAARDGNRLGVETLLSKYPIPSSFLHSATREAIKSGHLDLAVAISQFATDHPEMVEAERSPGKGQQAIIRVSREEKPIQPENQPSLLNNRYVRQIVDSPITGVALGMIGVYFVSRFI